MESVNICLAMSTRWLRKYECHHPEKSAGTVSSSREGMRRRVIPSSTPHSFDSSCWIYARSPLEIEHFRKEVSITTIFVEVIIAG